MAAAAVANESQWQKQGGTIVKATSSNGRITRTFVASSGEKFRYWKDCVKYMGRLPSSTPSNNQSPEKKKSHRDRKLAAHPTSSSGEEGHGIPSAESEHQNVKPPKSDKINMSKRSRETSPKGSPRSLKKGKKGATDVVNGDREKYELSSRPRRTAARTNFKEEKVFLAEKNDKIEIKKDSVVEGEDVAIVLTAEPGEEQTPERRVTDFIIHDEDGKSQHIEHLELNSLFLTALVLPGKGKIDKSKGFRCESFGPIESWSIVGYEQGSPVVVLTTDIADYHCLKPAAAYRHLFNAFYEKARVCVEVYRTISNSDGGNPQLALDEVIARVSRSFCRQGPAGQFFNRDYILNNGKFVAAQLTALDEYAVENQQLFFGLPALTALEQEGQRRTSDLVIESERTGRSGSVKIRDGETNCSAVSASAIAANSGSCITDDEKLARLLQEEDLRALTRQNRRPQPAMKGKVYIKVNEAEIADYYPLPAYYKAEEDEMDEYILFEDEASNLDPDCLPQRMLHDWALYNSDSRLISLELLPMLPGAETDMEIFGSGVITDDDGSGFCLDADDNALAASTEGNCSLKDIIQQGFRIYLSAIKEWKIEFGASMLFISCRTDGAWYRLGRPSSQYEAWYSPVLKTARLAVKVITMLKGEHRVSRLSFSDVVKKLTEEARDEPTFISPKVAEVERYVIVHGQIFLQQFSEYPDETIKKSAFITGLTVKMEQLNHTKLVLKKKVPIKKGKNLNPRANLKSDNAKCKPMRATTTHLVNRIWSSYYVDTPQEGTLPENPSKEIEELEDIELSDDEEETVFATGPKRQLLKCSSKKVKGTPAKVRWIGKSVGMNKNQEPMYGKASFKGETVVVGGSIFVNLDEGKEDQDQLATIVLVEYLYESKDGPMLHGRVLQRGTETVLGNAANERELFLTDYCEDVELDRIKGSVVVSLREREWGHVHRKRNSVMDEADRALGEEKEKKGLPREYFYRSWYSPERGAFLGIPKKSVGCGNGVCHACDMRQRKKDKMKIQILADNKGFYFEGIEYHVNEFLYLDPDILKGESIDHMILHKSGRNKGLHAFVICQLLSVHWTKAKKPKLASLHVRRFYRPEDVDSTRSYKADIHEVYYSEETLEVDIIAVRGKCEVRRKVEVPDTSTKMTLNHIFFCDCIHDPKKGTVKQLPANIKLSSSSLLEATQGKPHYREVAAKAKGKGKIVENDATEEALDIRCNGPLATLDIFAGCGGLSEGLHQSGVSSTKWAIEYDNSAAEAFKLNHPRAEVFCDNCNVILRSIMERGGNLDDCLSTPEADELSKKMDSDKKNKLPRPGEVDFINGGPPCQGFSGMNRFNQRAWSKVQCEMILSFLSFAEYFRPRFFLLENVRNFVSFNKGQTFRLTLASLLEMGYQVRFGVLQAGNYGVSQSRKRAFIWAAAPEETLPEWPEPLHVFASSQLKIALPGGLQYAAVRDAGQGAPLRSITVRDTIGDLPPVLNGAEKGTTMYCNLPESWFQKQIRGEEMTLYDHICKEMNELNLIRCQRIPREPGADWRNLPDEKVKLSTGQSVDLIPWCLPNTADRHNQWKGLFGRLDWDGNFPTSVTDPQPMGKVGMCFHPEQDRIVTVRECARSQGFPDSYKFFGTIQSKHRQIGNAVPPPMARALGFMLKEALCSKLTVQT